MMSNSLQVVLLDTMHSLLQLLKPQPALVTRWASSKMSLSFLGCTLFKQHPDLTSTPFVTEGLHGHL